MAPHLVFGPHFAFGGEADLEVAGMSVEGDTDPSLGVQARADIPLHRYFTLGPALFVSFWRAEDTDLDRNLLVDISILPKARFPFALGPEYGEVYAGLPIGLTIGKLRDVGPTARASDIDVGFGYNVGVLFGTQLFFTPSVGALFELGWMRRWTKHDTSIDQKLEVGLNQIALNLGVAVSF